MSPPQSLPAILSQGQLVPRSVSCSQSMRGAALGQGPAWGLSSLISPWLLERALGQSGPVPTWHLPLCHELPSLRSSWRRIQTLSGMLSGLGGFSVPPEVPQHLFWLAGASRVPCLPLTSGLDVDTYPLPLGARGEPLGRGEDFPKIFTPGSTTGNTEHREQRGREKWPQGSAGGRGSC